MLTVEIRIKAELRAWPLAVLTKRLSLCCVQRLHRTAFPFPKQEPHGRQRRKNQTILPADGSFCVCVCVCVIWVRVYVGCVFFVCVFGVWGRQLQYMKTRCGVFTLTIASPRCVSTAACVRLGCVRVWLYSVYMCWGLSVCVWAVLQSDLDSAWEALGLVFPMDRKWPTLLNYVLSSEHCSTHYTITYSVHVFVRESTKMILK